MFRVYDSVYRTVNVQVRKLNDGARRKDRISHE